MGLELLLAEAVRNNDIVFWFDVPTRSRPDWEGVHASALQVITKHLSTRDVLACRLACKTWCRASPRWVAVVDVPLKGSRAAAFANSQAQRLAAAFPALHTLVLSSLSAAALPPGMTLSHVASSLRGFSNLRRLVLQELPCSHPPFPLSSLTAVKRLTALDVKFARPSGLQGGFEGALGAAPPNPLLVQDAILRGLSSLTHIRYLHLKLLSVQTGHACVDDALASLLREATNCNTAVSAPAPIAAPAAAAGPHHEGPHHEGPYNEGPQPPPPSPQVPPPFSAAPRLPTSCLPDLSCVLGLSQLQTLSLHNCILSSHPPSGEVGLEQLLTQSTQLTSLDLQGMLLVSHAALAAVRGLPYLTSLGLGRVKLAFNHDDVDDCPERMMHELYQSLLTLRGFRELRLDLDCGCTYPHLHSAYLIDIYEAALPALQRLQLSTVAFDSDSTFHLLALLQTLTSLELTYVTQPLSLYPNDMSSLAPLTLLRDFHLVASEAEEQFLLSLTSDVLAVLKPAWTRLQVFEYSGHIQLDSDYEEALATWTSLRDLQLTHSLAPRYDEPGCVPELLELSLACLPPHLTRLSFTNVRVAPEALLAAAPKLACLKSLQLSRCGMTHEHLSIVPMLGRSCACGAPGPPPPPSATSSETRAMSDAVEALGRDQLAAAGKVAHSCWACGATSSSLELVVLEERLMHEWCEPDTLQHLINAGFRCLCSDLPHLQYLLLHLSTPCPLTLDIAPLTQLTALKFLSMQSARQSLVLEDPVAVLSCLTRLRSLKLDMFTTSGEYCGARKMQDALTAPLPFIT